MRLRSLAVWVMMLGLTFVASPVLAQGKTKKVAVGISASQGAGSSQPDSKEPEAAKQGEPEEAVEPAPAPAAAPPEEEIPEPDAWERPPQEEEKAPVRRARPAPREEKVGDGRHFELGLLLGYGFRSTRTFSLDPYGLGLGGHVGYELDFKLYLGLNFVYHLGSSGELNRLVGAPIDSSSNYMLVNAEVGYDLWIDRVILRPSLWLGAGIGAQDPHPQTLRRRTLSDFALSPGASVLYTADIVFVGLDLRYHIVTGDGETGVGLYLSSGLRF